MVEDDYLLEQNKDKPDWFKAKIKSIPGLDEKRKPSMEPSWSTCAFMETISNQVLHAMMKHGNKCRKCFNKMNSVYLHAAEEERKNKSAEELKELGNLLTAELKKHI
jgi:hypothetical protein